MTRRALESRLRSLDELLGERLTSPVALDDLYSRFLQSGELPAARTPAWDVLKRTLCARRGGKVSHQGHKRPLAGPPREQVFREAVHEHEIARSTARALIQILIDAGLDPTDPEFIPSDFEAPDFGSTALHVFGWPDAWVKPPYEQQMERVMRQHAELRAVAGERSEWWWRGASAALSTFMTRGEVPTEPDLQLFVLTITEMFAIQAHYFGRGNEPLITAFADVAATTGTQRDEALVRLGQLQALAKAPE